MRYTEETEQRYSDMHRKMDRHTFIQMDGQTCISANKQMDRELHKHTLLDIN